MQSVDHCENYVYAGLLFGGKLEQKAALIQNLWLNDSLQNIPEISYF